MEEYKLSLTIEEAEKLLEMGVDLDDMEAVNEALEELDQDAFEQNINSQMAERQE